MVWVMDSREPTISRLAPATLLPPLAKATRTESSMPNSRNAVTMDSRVNRVRVRLRNSWAHINEKYFMAHRPAHDRARGFAVKNTARVSSLPHSFVQRGVDQLALVQMHGVGGVFGRLGIVGDHDDGLAVFAVEQLQQAQHFFGALAVEVAGGLVADQEGRVRDDRPGNPHALLLAAGPLVGAMVATVGAADPGPGDLREAIAIGAAEAVQ